MNIGVALGRVGATRHLLSAPSIILIALVGSHCRPRQPVPSTGLAYEVDRQILGPGRYHSVRRDVSESVLKASMTERRRYAWDLIERISTPVKLNNPVSGETVTDGTGGDPIVVPLWLTWYDFGEVVNLAEELHKRAKYTNVAGDALELPASETLVDELLRSTVRQAPSDDADQKSRFERRLAQLNSKNTLPHIHGAQSTGFTLFSPDLVRHLLINYRKIASCQKLPSRSLSTPGTDFGRCLGGPLPDSAIAVKTAWRPADRRLPIWNTSADGLAELATRWSSDWSENAVDSILPDSRDIIRGQRFDARRAVQFNLVGMHVMAKELPHWTWTTLWWAADPALDFGEDRPPTAKGDPTYPWRNYKMCTATAFDEQDQNITGEALTDSSLLRANRAWYQLTGPGSSCSNPFIEQMSGAVKTNCIGCHQHAGPDDLAASRKSTVAQQRSDFPADYLWSVDADGESFLDAFAAIVSPAAQVP